MSDAEVRVQARVQATRVTKRFCRRCLRWHPPGFAQARNEIFVVGTKAVMLDYVLCSSCHARADHRDWYYARAVDRRRTSYNEEAVTKAFSADVRDGSS